MSVEDWGEDLELEVRNRQSHIPLIDGAADEFERGPVPRAATRPQIGQDLEGRLSEYAENRHPHSTGEYHSEAQWRQSQDP